MVLTVTSSLSRSPPFLMASSLWVAPVDWCKLSMPRLDVSDGCFRQPVLYVRRCSPRHWVINTPLYLVIRSAGFIPSKRRLDACCGRSALSRTKRLGYQALHWHTRAPFLFPSRRG